MKTVAQARCENPIKSGACPLVFRARTGFNDKVQVLMILETTNNTTNAFLGVSLGKSYYSIQRIKHYLSWAEINFGSFAFLIGDFLYRYTLAGLKGVPLDEAKDRSLQMGEETAQMLTNVSKHARIPVTVLRWNDITSMPEFIRLLHVVNDVARHNVAFQAAVRKQVWLNLGNGVGESGVSEDPVVHNAVSEYFDSYIKEEIAGLITVSEHTEFHTEIYPGRDLEVLENIYKNTYPEISAVLPKNRKRQFTRIYIE